MNDPTVSIEPLAVRKTTAAKLIEVGGTKLWQLVKSGQLKVIRVGKDERVTVDSIKKFVEAGGETGGDDDAKAA